MIRFMRRGIFVQIEDSRCKILLEAFSTQIFVYFNAELKLNVELLNS